MEMEDDGLDELLADICEPTSPKRNKPDDDGSVAVPLVPKITLHIHANSPNALFAKTAQTLATIYLSGFNLTGTSQETVTKPSISKAHCVLVNPKQKGNPLLKCIKSVVWEYDDIISDYEIGKTIGILFLSLRYHNMNPEYIHNRLKELGKKYDLRVLLVQVDIKDPTVPLKSLTRICLLTDLTLMLAWNSEEAARVVENYKIYQNKPPDRIMEKIENDPHQKIINALTSVRSVNKTDAMTLITTFNTLENIIKATETRLAECPGFGATKAKKLYTALHQPFLKRGQVTKEMESDKFQGDLSLEDVEKLENEIQEESSCK